MRAILCWCEFDVTQSKKFFFALFLSFPFSAASLFFHAFYQQLICDLPTNSFLLLIFSFILCSKKANAWLQCFFLSVRAALVFFLSFCNSKIASRDNSIFICLYIIVYFTKIDGWKAKDAHKKTIVLIAVRMMMLMVMICDDGCHSMRANSDSFIESKFGQINCQ